MPRQVRRLWWRGPAAHEDVAHDQHRHQDQHDRGDGVAEARAGHGARDGTVPFHGGHARATVATARSDLRVRTAFGLGTVPVGTIMPQAPSSAPGSNSSANSRSRSNAPGSFSSPVFSAEKPKRA